MGSGIHGAQVRALATAALLFAACEPSPPSIHFRLDDSSVGQCPSSDCTGVSVTCRMWMGIRIIDPTKPLSPYLDQCDEVPERQTQDICAIGGIDLKQQEVPVRDLEVQVALFPESMITKDENGEWVCPTTTQFDATTGFPIASDQTPAVGGRTFYHVGDDTIVVNLGCTDLTPIQACGSADQVAVAADVFDFDSALEFTGPMTVSVGEPISADPFHLLGPAQLTSLTFNPTQLVKKWRGNISKFPSYACLAVLDDSPQSTTSVVCYDPNPTNGNHLDWPFPGDDTAHVSTGIRLSKAALDQMLAAQGLSSFPPHGMTIGIVVDEDGTPMANQVVQTLPAGSGTVNYFSADRTGIDLGMVTTESGAFVSLDAPFGTTFRVNSTLAPVSVSRIGGRIDGKVTIVILRFTGGSGG